MAVQLPMKDAAARQPVIQKGRTSASVLPFLYSSVSYKIAYDSDPLSLTVTARPCSSRRSMASSAADGASCEDESRAEAAVEGGDWALPSGCESGAGAGGLIVRAIASSFCARLAGACLLGGAAVDAPSPRSARASSPSSPRAMSSTCDHSTRAVLRLPFNLNSI